MIRLKRVYEAPSREDGYRILVERLWPRGLTKQRARIDLWLKEIAPSPELRTWFGHEPARWKEFCKRYRTELRSKKALLDPLLHMAREGTVTLVFAARDGKYNSAVALKRFLHEPWIK